MNDLIDRQKAIKTAKVMYERCSTGDIADLRDLICESIAVLPKVDAVPVVRCKDCKRYIRTDNKKGNWCRERHKYTKDESYCSWAERRIDERTD